MAENMDTRVIQLKFENKEFERNIAKSQKSIEDLKEAMDFEETSRGLNRFTDAFDFSKMENNLQKITDKFTGFGNATEFVMSRIRRSIENAAISLESFVKSLSVSQISVGQNKYDQLNKAVMAIVSGGKATEEQAYSTMERAMEYTRQTSHDFNTMVTQISGLTSIGMGLRDAEMLIEAIGNAATYAGKGAQEAAASMGVISKSISGFLSYERFIQLSQTMGVVTDKWRQQALEAAEAVGTLKKKNDQFVVSVKGMKAVEVTAANLENTLKYRWLTGDVLKKLYENYQFANSGDYAKDMEDLAHPTKAVDSFGKTAYLTGQRALTLADAINSIKESVSSGWMESFRIVFGDVTEAAEHFTNIADRIIEFVEKIQTFRNQLLSSIASQGGRTGIMELLLGDYEKEVDEGTVGLIDLLEETGSVLSKAFWDFIKVLNPAMMLSKAFSDDKWENNAEYRIYILSDMIRQFIDNIKSFFIGIKTFFNEDINVNGRMTTRLQMIHEIISGISGALGIAWTIGDEIVKFINGLGQDLDPAISAVLDLLARFGLAIFDTAQDTQKAGKIQKFFQDLRTNLKPITDGINQVITSLTNLISLIFGLEDGDKDRSGAFDTLGKVLLTISDVVSKVIGPILQFFSRVIDAFSVFKDGFNKESIQKFGKQLSAAFQEMMKSFADSMPDEFKGLRDFIYDLFGLWEDDKQAKERGKSLGTFIHNIFVQGFGGIGEFISSLFGGFSLKQAIDTGLGFGSAFNFLQTIANFFKNTNLYSILMGFLGVTTLATLWSLFSQVKKAVKTIGGFFDDVGGNLMSGATGRYQWFTEKLLDIAKAVGIFVLCIMALGSMDTGKLAQGVIALAVTLGMVVGLWILLERSSIATSKLSQQIMMETLIITLAAAVTAICVALSVLMLAMIPLSSDPKKMLTAILGVAAFLTMLGAFFKIMLDKLNTFTLGSTNQWAGIGKMAAMMFTLAGSIAIICVAISVLVVAITPLVLTGWEGTMRAVVAVGAILTMFGLFINIMLRSLDDFALGLGGRTDGKSIAKMAAMLFTLAGSILLLAAGIGLIVLAITPLAVMSWDKLARAIIGLGLIMTELGLFIKAIQVLSTGDKSVSVKIAGLALFALSLGLLVAALVPLAMMSWGGWARAILGLGLVLTELIGYMKLVKAANVKNVELVGFAAFAASVGILMLALVPIAGLDWGQWGRAMIGLGIVLLELVGFMKLVSKMNVHIGSLYGFIGFAASLAILMYSLKFVATLTTEQYIRGIVGLGTLMLMIVVLLSIIKEIQPDLKTAGSTLMLLVGVGVAMILFSIAMNEVKNVPWETMVAFAGGISALLIAIAFASTLAKAGGIKGMLILALGLAAVIAVIALMAPMLISGISTALAESAGQLSLMATLMQGFSGKMDGVSEDSMDKAKRIVSKMLELLKLMFAFGVWGDQFTAFTKAVSQLTLVSGELKTMTNRFNAVDYTAFDKFKDFVVKLKLFLSTTLSGFGNYIQTARNFSSVMYELGTGIEIFNNHTSGLELDPENNPAIKTIQALANCAGDLDVISKMNIDDLTAKISGLGGAMILYAEGAKAATGMDIDQNTPDVTAALALMRAITTGLAENGGIVIPENMPTEESLGLYGAQLAALAAALIQFEEAGKNLGDGTDKALETLNFFQQLKERLIETNFQENITAFDVFGTGEEASEKAGVIETFGKNIEQLGLSLGQFANSTTYLDKETGELKTYDYSKATASLEAIRKVAEQLPSFGGVLTILTGTKEDLTTFAGEIEAIGVALNDFHTNTSSMDKANETTMEFDYSNATKALNDIAEIPKKLPNYGGVIALFEGDPPSLTKLAGDIVGLGAGLEEFSRSVVGDGTSEHPGFDPDCAEPAIKVVNSMVEFMEKIQNKLGTIGGFSNIWNTIWGGRDFTLTDLGTQIGEMGEGLGTFGSKISGKFKNVEEIENAMKVVSSVVDMMVRLTQLSETQIYSGTGFGVYAQGFVEFLDTFTNGFVNGFGDEFGPAVDNIAILMSTISKAIDNMGDIKSQNIDMFANLARALTYLASLDPTKLEDFQNVGKSIATGIATGIETNTSIVTEAAAKLAKETYEATMAALDAASPSKLFMDVGSYIPQGMAIGMDDTNKTVTESAQNMAKGIYDATSKYDYTSGFTYEFDEFGKLISIVDSEMNKTIRTYDSYGNLVETVISPDGLTKAIKQYDAAGRLISVIDEAMSGELGDSSPTITPVLDMTNIEEGMKNLNLTGDAGIGITLDGNNLTVTLDNPNEAITPTDYTASISKIGEDVVSLRTGISELSKSMQNIKLMMDTGAVVGAIGPDMDKYLGQKSFYASRTDV